MFASQSWLAMFLNKSWLAVRVRITLASSTVPIRLNHVLTRITWCVQCQSISNTVYLLTKACACSDSRSQSIINQRIGKGRSPFHSAQQSYPSAGQIIAILVTGLRYSDSAVFTFTFLTRPSGPG